MARRVFFSFHYERDIWRASQIRNSWVTKPDRESAGFWDSAKWEEVKRKGDASIRRWIDFNMKGTSVTAVLIGSETCYRKWVRYEIEKSIEKGNDIIGIRIHNMKDQYGETDWPGELDFGLGDGEHTFQELYPVYDWVNDDGYENLGPWIEEAVVVESKEDSIWDVLAKLALVGIGLGVLSSIFKPRCPYCNRTIDRGVSVCPHCGYYLSR